ncbi:MAG: hypothetical protein AB7S92_23035 [Parvibaculaceae bacterium]
MDDRAHRRFALAVVASLEDTLTITRHLVQADLEPRLISVIGQEASFAGERRHAVELALILGRSGMTPRLAADSNRIVALSRDCEDLPEAAARHAGPFGKLPLQWLPSDHAERIADVLNRGEFLLLVELHSMVDERVAARILLRDCRRPVEVHDVRPAADELRP